MNPIVDQTLGELTMCNENSEPKIFSIPSWNVPVLEAKIAKLNKRAAKLGCDPIQLVTHKVENVDDPNHKPVHIDNLPTPAAPKIAIHHIEVIGNGPILEGWKFIGTLDHTSIPGSVIVKSVPGEVIPKSFYHSNAVCGHCNKKRYRNETFVLEHTDTGEYKEVGRQCIKDFLGHNPGRMASYLTALYSLIDDLQDEESEYYGMGGGRGIWMFSSMDALTTTVAMIRSFGWTPRSKAEYSNTSATADDVLYALSPCMDGQEAEAKKKFMEQVKWDDEKDQAEAEAALEWLKEQPANNDYMHNLHAISQLDDVPANMFGYWCSLVSSYQRAYEKLKLAERQQKLNDWVGEIKQRRDFEVELIGVKTFDGYYGLSYMHKFLDKDGRTLIWFASNDSDMEVDSKYIIKATVKKHDTYNNWKQTTINRAKVIKEL